MFGAEADVSRHGALPVRELSNPPEGEANRDCRKSPGLPFKQLRGCPGATRRLVATAGQDNILYVFSVSIN